MELSRTCQERNDALSPRRSRISQPWILLYRPKVRLQIASEPKGWSRRKAISPVGVCNFLKVKGMTKFGFKEITSSNWLEPDRVLKGFVTILPNGRSQPITGDEYLNRILAPKLVESLPAEVQALFEVARGGMVYGYFFYPLYTLAAEQLFRVVEAAVAHKCKALGTPRSRRTFEKRIDWLVEGGVIPRSESARWHAARKLRNAASHLEHQMILTPGNAIGMLESIADDLNSLFNGGLAHTIEFRSNSRERIPLNSDE